MENPKRDGAVMARAEDNVVLGEAKAKPPPGPVSIRMAELSDVERISVIEARAFSNPWHPQTFRSLIEKGGARILVAEANGAGVVGYAVVWWVLEQGELANLAVSDGVRGRGVGSALLDRVLDEAAEAGVESLFLEVRTSNDRAWDLYRSRGFEQVGIRRDYYRKPMEDARILVKRLDG